MGGTVTAVWLLVAGVVFGITSLVLRDRREAQRRKHERLLRRVHGVAEFRPRGGKDAA